MKLSKKLSVNSGFTLVELLVVIGILGILAAGLLAAIDPLEQLKKGRDTQKRTVAVELTNAIQRYYAVFGSMPWGNGAWADDVTGSAAFINLLTGAGELKPTFTAGMPAGTALVISILGGANAAGVSVCFDPESKSISRDPSTLFSAVGSYPPTIGTNPGTTDTGWYWCTR
ncbi:MAG: type II secretion system protein [Patescibacteria group bacterium]